MDIKILLLGLLFITVDVFPAYAGPVAGEEEIVVKQEKETTEEDYQNQVNANKIEMATSIANTEATKAKALLSIANVYSQVTNERKNYHQEYIKLAEEMKAKAKENEQKAVLEAASIDSVENRRKEWEVKYREADTQAKNQEVLVQQHYSEAQEWCRKMEAATVAAASEEAQATALLNLASSDRQWSHELKSRAEELHDGARNHYTKAKEAEQKATAEKVKVQQQGEEAQKRFQAAKILQQQILKAEVASQAHLAKFIALTIQAEEAKNKAKEHELCASMEETKSSELMKRAQYTEAIAKILANEHKFYLEKAKREEGQANVNYQSAKEAVSEGISHGALMMQLATAKESDAVNEDIEPLASSPVQELKNMPFVAHKIID